MNDANKRIEWKARYDAWEASGLSAAEWCRNEDEQAPNVLLDS